MTAPKVFVWVFSLGPSSFKKNTVMADKYKSLRRKLHKQQAKEKMCLDKVAFPTKEAVYQKGQTSYQCKYCGQWHRSGKMARFLAKFTPTISHYKIR